MSETVIRYTSRQDANFFTDFAGNQKPEDMGERMWYYDEKFFEPELCDELVEQIRKDNPKFIKGTGLYIPPEGDKKYRDSNIHFIDDMENPIYKEVRDTAIINTLKHNHHIWNYDLTHLMNMQYTQYNEHNQHFNWHKDGPLGIDVKIALPDDLVFRKISTVVCLSDHTDYDGGEFMILDGSASPDQSICSFKMTKGEAIVFPAFMLHRVVPVTKGLRTSLVNWFCGPRWK